MLNLINYIINDTILIVTLIIVITNICIHYIFFFFNGDVKNHHYDDKQSNITIHKFKDSYLLKSEKFFKEIIELILDDIILNNYSQFFIIQIIESSYDDSCINPLSEPCLFYYDKDNLLTVNELYNKLTWLDGALNLSDKKYKDIAIIIRKI